MITYDHIWSCSRPSADAPIASFPFVFAHFKPIGALGATAARARETKVTATPVRLGTALGLLTGRCRSSKLFFEPLFRGLVFLEGLLHLPSQGVILE